MKKQASRIAAMLLCGLMISSTAIQVLPNAQPTAHAADAYVGKFDFGPVSSPVLAGYNQVHDQMTYTQARGYGLETALPTGASRNRSGGTDLTNDFILGTPFTFLADVPNGNYNVTIYSGDLLAGTSTTKTSVSLEGVAKGTISTKTAIAQATYSTTVTDGQLTVGITTGYSGTGAGYLNGLIIEQVIATAPSTPTALTVTNINPTAGAASVSLAWNSVTDAVYYNMYRATNSATSYDLISQVPTNSFMDTAVSAGNTYSYQVTAINAGGLESTPSTPVSAEVVQTVTIPAPPSNVIVSGVTAGQASLQWTASAGATGYTVLRSDSADGTYTEIATVASTSFTDTTADTSAPHYYQVKASNTAGISAASNVAASTVFVVPNALPSDLPLKIDFGPGAVADGYFGITAPVAYSAQLKYGFADPSLVGSGNSGTADPLKSDYLSPGGTSFNMDLPNGDYAVSVTAGDASAATEVAVSVEGMTANKIALTSKAAGDYLEQSFEVALVDGQLNIFFSGSAPKINGLVISKLPNRVAGETSTVYIAGDSTVQTYDPYWKPQAGWGQMISRYFTSDITFSNQSIGGRSSKTFLTEGRLDTILRAIKPNDYFLIQFGHNDATISVPERYASPADFKNYLKTYINGARQRGAIPILVTPVGRRDYNATTGLFNVSFPEYVDAMKTVAQEMDVKLVDLSSLSRAYYNTIGPIGTLAVFLHVPAGTYTAFPSGNADDTHFQEYGAIQIARLLSGGIKDLSIPLSAYVTDIAPPTAVPSKPTGVVASSISNAGAVLTWNTVEGADIYKIYRKLASETDYVLVGTSTIPSITTQGMTEGQTYHVVATAINGKGESEQSDVVVITTKHATIKYDFGLAASPVQEGYTGVNLSTVYTADKGYGIKNPTGMIGRDRATGTDLLRDWLGYFNVGWEFMVDLPNGLYSVKLYVGDYLGSARTTVAIEGTDYGTVTAGNKSVVEKIIPQTSVSDGQMNFKFGGSTGIVNGLEITPILMAPSVLKVESKQVDPANPSITLSWIGVEDAAKYNVYRKVAGTSKFELLGSATTNTYIDNTVDVGMNYEYQVTTVDLAGVETGPSGSITVSMIDPTVPVPDVPVHLQVSTVNKNDLTISWDEVTGAKTYNIYRSKSAGGSFELIGKSNQASYTDTTVLTTIPYYYKVAAVSAGGVSGQSETLETPAVTVLNRQAEYLDRALVAVKQDNGVYVGWKMLGTDASDIAFNLYRDGVKVNTAPIKGATNLLDEAGTDSSVYLLKTVIAGKERAASKETTVWQQNYMSIPMQKPEGGITKAGEAYTYSANDTSVGDVDGDGTYELIVKWDPSNSHDNSQAGYTGNVYLDAYKLDGTRLWRIGLGPNIRAGAHYTQFQVFDLDGDGKAEVALKTADGTIDGTGVVIGDASADHRNSSGYVLEGPEFLTVFDGLTGRAITTTNYDPPRGVVTDWGDAYGNRVDRFLAGVAYLDGEHPSLIFSRGYYTRTVIVAYDYKNGALTKRWCFDTNDEGLGAAYTAQGDHNLSIGDVDGDGKDEITFGAMAIDDDGTPLYNTGLGHGDAQHLGDLDPSRPGLEFFNVHEHTDSPYGMDFRDARTGEILWGVWTGIDTGRGMSADIDPNYLGEEVWAATITNAQHIPLTGLYSAKGELISTTIPSSTNFGIWWDGDLNRELLDSNRIDKWDYVNHVTNNLFTADDALSNNSTKATPNLQADLFGDWREEVVWRNTDSSELRIYTTSTWTETRLRTLMHDPIYRLGVAWQNTGYNQPPHTSFYLGVGMTEPAQPHLAIVNQPAPAIPPVTTDDAPTGWVNHPVKVTLTVSDSGSGVGGTFYTVDGKPTQQGTTISLSDEGSYVITYWSVDSLGNQEDVKTTKVNIDTTGPVIVPTSAMQVFWTDGGSLTFDISDPLSGFVSKSFELDGAQVSLPYSFNPFSLEIGDHTVKVTAADSAGNETVGTYSLKVQMDANHLDEAVRYANQQNWIYDPATFTNLLDKIETLQAHLGKPQAKNDFNMLENYVHAQSGKTIDMQFAASIINAISFLKNGREIVKAQ
ncbi:OmpL47-type beta-barrel domain-containing protein [Paenibacillus sp. LjRoot56]|uniref:rhamnogalacturonan lyase family protein n=1 Tax=Paenibacillus sp. LjRoot56 TaxID=3342333 RepID=UPI003ECFB061